MSADRKPVVSGGGPGMRGNFSRRFRTAEQIEISARSGDRAFLPLLIRALGDQDPALQRAACDALPKMGEAGFQAVLRAAAHGNKRERESAVWMLGTWGDVRAVGPLLLALHHDGKERRLRNLGLLVTMVGYNILIFAGGLYSGANPFFLTDRYDWNWYLEAKWDVALRTRAAIALGRLGDVRAIVPLTHLMRDDAAGVSNAAQVALCQLMPLAAALSPDQFRTLGDDAALALAGLLATASEPLARSTLAALSVCCDPRTLPAVQAVCRRSDSPRRPDDGTASRASSAGTRSAGAAANDTAAGIRLSSWFRSRPTAPCRAWNASLLRRWFPTAASNRCGNAPRYHQLLKLLASIVRQSSKYRTDASRANSACSRYKCCKNRCLIRFARTSTVIYVTLFRTRSYSVI